MDEHERKPVTFDDLLGLWCGHIIKHSTKSNLNFKKKLVPEEKVEDKINEDKLDIDTGESSLCKNVIRRTHIGEKYLLLLSPSDFHFMTGNVNLRDPDSSLDYTVEELLQICRKVIEFGIKKGYLSYNPMVPIEDLDVNFWNPEEVSKFLRYVDKKYKKKSRWTYLFYLLSLRTGLKINEVIALQWKDVCSKNKLKVSRLYNKRARRIINSDKPRELLVDDVLVKELLAMKKKSNAGFIFSDPNGNPRDVDNIRKKYKLDVESARVRKIQLSDFQDTFAINELIKGRTPSDLQKILGSEYDNKVDTYMHVIRNRSQK